MQSGEQEFAATPTSAAAPLIATCASVPAGTPL
jgi:hypothetical protein